MGRFRQAMYRFMYGRYGSDELGTLIFWVYFALLILNLLLRSLVLYILLLALLSLYLFRCFSRNHERRRRDSRKDHRIFPAADPQIQGAKDPRLPPLSELQGDRAAAAPQRTPCRLLPEVRQRFQRKSIAI